MTFPKIVFIAVWLLSGSVAFGQTAEKKTLTLDGAERVIAAAKTKAQELKSPGGVIAVVDAGGNLMALARIDGTFAAGANISIGKARTAVLFQKPTKVFEDIINKGRTAMAALPDSFFTPLQGGIPVVLDGQHRHCFPKPHKGMKLRANIVELYRFTSISFLNPGAAVQHPKEPSRVRTGCLVLYLPAKLDFVSWSGDRCSQ
jgi:uncharacterized protein GlcG (DUF336 family)